VGGAAAEQLPGQLGATRISRVGLPAEADQDISEEHEQLAIGPVGH
jgi:hypothetical protein